MFSGPILLFGGPYSNLQATEALKAEAKRLGIGADHCICTGDVVAYGADPQATVDLIRDWGVHVILGNCEQSLANDADDCGCGFEEGSTCESLSDHWYQFAKSTLNKDSLDWMNGLQPMLRFTYAGQNVLVLHGGFDNINQFVFASTSKTFKRRQLGAAKADIIIGGHSGIPFTQGLKDRKIWHNAGTIGLPANDGTTDVWYSLLQKSDTGATFSHHRLAYDFAKSADRMRAENLAEGYAQAMEKGLWPSLDILPHQERKQTGEALILPTPL